MNKDARHLDDGSWPEAVVAYAVAAFLVATVAAAIAWMVM